MHRRIVVRNGEGRTLYAGEASSEGPSANWQAFLPSPPQEGERYTLTEMEIGGRGKDGVWIGHYDGRIGSHGGLVCDGRTTHLRLDAEKIDQMGHLLGMLRKEPDPDKDIDPRGEGDYQILETKR